MDKEMLLTRQSEIQKALQETIERHMILVGGLNEISYWLNICDILEKERVIE